jgi:hypothetical protein
LDSLVITILDSRQAVMAVAKSFRLKPRPPQA